MSLSDAINTVHRGDCIQGMNALPAGSMDLVFADPPFNIGYEYDVYDDSKERRNYLAWSRDWISAAYRVLKPSGTFWLAIGDEFAAELKLTSQEIGFHSRSWVIWYYTFGVNCKQKFSRSHAHLFYFVKDPRKFTFRFDELENRIPSARQLVYADNRANPNGRLPDDTWVLRPQDLTDCFTTSEDTWYFPRVAGTFKERAGFHGCQMPEQLLGRIIRLCSEAGDIVLDPFSGSATTVAVAKKLGRRYVAFDVSEDYVNRGTARLKTVCLADPLEGASEPTLSAPATPRKSAKKSRVNDEALPKPTDGDAASSKQLSMFYDGLLEAFRRTYDGFSLDRVVADPELNERLAAACRELGLPGEPRDWNWMLFGMRKTGQLVRFPTIRRTEIRWEACDDFLFASEIAWRQLIDSGCESLDYILCDPVLASSFDEVARGWAPGYRPLDYRWAAMKLRKSAKQVRTRAKVLVDAHFSDELSLDGGTIRKLPEQPGVYVVTAVSEKKPIYAGEASNLRQRLKNQFGPKTRPAWKAWSKLTARYFPTSCPCTDRLAYQRRLVMQQRPLLNLPDPMHL